MLQFMGSQRIGHDWATELNWTEGIQRLRETGMLKRICHLRPSHPHWLCGSQQTVENSSRDGNTRPPYLPPVKPVCRSRRTFRTRHGTMDWFKIGKEVCQGCILSFCLFNLHAEYIIRNARLDEAQAWIKIAGRNINNLRYADDTTLTAESKEELKSFFTLFKKLFSSSSLSA